MTILGLTECHNPGDKILGQVMRFIPLGIIMKNLVYVHKLFIDNEKYKDYRIELFKNFKEQSEFIIELGFSLFFIINLMLEQKK